MKNLVPLAVLALGVAVATPALAQEDDSNREPLSFASSTLTIPTSANVPGQQGAFFQTHVSLMNPTKNAFTVHVSFYDASGTRRTADIALLAGELKLYENFIQAIFNTQSAGALTFTTDDTAGGTRNNRFILSTETWTLDANLRRFGTTVPVLEFPGSATKSFAAGVKVNADNRTNVGCFNQSNETNPVKVTIFDGQARVSSTVNMELPANAWGQQGVPSDVTDGYAQFEPTENAVCWAVVVSNSSNDGRFVFAVEYAP